MTGGGVSRRTRMRTRLPLTSMSEMASLLESDMFAECEGRSVNLRVELRRVLCSQQEQYAQCYSVDFSVTSENAPRW